MKAWRILRKGHPSESLTLQTITGPEPDKNQIAIRVEAAVINFADILVCQGIYQNRPEVPFTPGLEAAGTVIAVGGNAKFKLGDKVAGMTALPNGSFAEQCLLNNVAALKYPDSTPFVDAGILYNTFLTAHIGLFRRGRLRTGEKLLVLAGSGGVGSAAIQLGRIAGAEVIAAASSAKKLAYCQTLGANHLINYKTDDIYERLGEITDGKGIDVCFDPVGSELTEPVRRRLSFEGRYIIIGFAGGEIPNFPANHILVKNYDVIGSAWTDYLQQDRAVVEHAFEEILDHYHNGRIKIGKVQSVN
ncbi:MAG: NADPH:quinone oxidoreductase family protein, partial [Gammaproteobacteria bacterium]